MPDDPTPLAPPAQEDAATTTGLAFFGWLTRHLCERLGVRYAFAGEVVGDEWDRVRTVAVHQAEGGPAPALEYELRGTPCAHVIGHALCVYPKGVRKQFPDDRLLTEMDIESYGGAPLFDSANRPLGLLVVCDTNAMQDTALVTRTLREFVPRAAAELERRRAVEELRILAEAAWSVSSDDFFGSLCRHLARMLRVRVAFVAELPRDDVDERGRPRRMRTIALWKDGRIAADASFALAGTPFESLPDGEPKIVPRDVRAQHPRVPFLEDASAEGIIALPFADKDGAVLGAIGVVHDRPLDERLYSGTWFKVFAERAGAELQRRREEERRIEAERRLTDARRLESLGVLAGGAAHDFNNLLSGILGNVDLVLEELGEESPLHRRLSEVKRAAQNAAELARQLLAYAGKGRLEMHRFDLGALAEEVAAGIHSAGAAGATARIERRIEPDLPPLEADVTQVRQVLSNLLWNAIEASPATGKVALSIELRRVHAADLADAVVETDLVGREAFVIRVSDSGHGMDAATRRRVFEPFFSTKAAGRGLGLAAVLGIVTGHGGTIAIESAAGRGSTFTVLLPLPSPSAGA